MLPNGGPSNSFLQVSPILTLIIQIYIQLPAFRQRMSVVSCQLSFGTSEFGATYVGTVLCQRTTYGTERKDPMYSKISKEFGQFAALMIEAHYCISVCDYKERIHL